MGVRCRAQRGTIASYAGGSKPTKRIRCPFGPGRGSKLNRVQFDARSLILFVGCNSLFGLIIFNLDHGV